MMSIPKTFTPKTQAIDGHDGVPGGRLPLRASLVELVPTEATHEADAAHANLQLGWDDYLDATHHRDAGDSGLRAGEHSVPQIDGGAAPESDRDMGGCDRPIAHLVHAAEHAHGQRRPTAALGGVPDGQVLVPIRLPTVVYWRLAGSWYQGRVRIRGQIVTVVSAQAADVGDQAVDLVGVGDRKRFLGAFLEFVSGEASGTPSAGHHLDRPLPVGVASPQSRALLPLLGGLSHGAHFSQRPGPPHLSAGSDAGRCRNLLFRAAPSGAATIR